MVIRGTYLKSGLGHFSTCRPKFCRPKFYAEVEKRTGLALHPGTINIRCEPEVFPAVPEAALRIDGVDEIDLNEDQYLLLGPGSIKGIQGYRILPVVRPDRKAGHDSEGIIKISLVGKLDLRNGDELEVTSRTSRGDLSFRREDGNSAHRGPHGISTAAPRDCLGGTNA